MKRGSICTWVLNDATSEYGRYFVGQVTTCGILCLIRIVLCLVLFGLSANAEECVEYFDTDPRWEGMNNRGEKTARRHVVQNFGYSPDKEIDGIRGAIGGTICPDGTPAYYALAIEPLDFTKAFSARGKVLVEKGGGNTLLGFFNSKTINEWRTPNSLVFRINGRDDIFHTHIEYATSKWRAGAGVIGRYDKTEDRLYPVELPSGVIHTWSLTYDPQANKESGRITVTFDDLSTQCTIEPAFMADGASFDRFGFLNVLKHADSPGKIWITSLEISNQSIDLRKDPKWTALHNHINYDSDETRPRFNFGYSTTSFAKGAHPGEIGGLFFRGDCRYPDLLGYYGAKLDTLTLAKPIRASGKIVLRRAVSDSTSLFGFFNAEHSVKVTASQKNALPMDYLGLCVEGPSSQGFYVYPGYRVHGDGSGVGAYNEAPKIHPDGMSHNWTLEYIPANDGGAVLTVTLDNVPCRVKLTNEDVAQGASFNRFGFVTPWIDGNGQILYLDDLCYTVKQ